MKIEIRCPQKSEIPELFDLLKVCFPTDRKTFEAMEREGLSVFGYKPKALFIDGRIVSNVSLVRRDIYLGSRILKGAGISSVATHPNYRRRGYIKILLEKRLDEITGKGLDFSPLFTGKPIIYEKLGWKTWPQKFWIAEKIKVPSDLKLNTKYENIKLIRHSNENLIKSVKRIYQQTMLSFPGALRRDEKYWKIYFYLFDIEDNDLFLLFSQENITTAYARIHWEGKALLLGEMGIDRRNKRGLKFIFHSIWNEVKKHGREKLIISLPPSHPLFEFLRSGGIELKKESLKKREILMIKIIDSGGKVLDNREVRSQFHWCYFDKF